MVATTCSEEKRPASAFLKHLLLAAKQAKQWKSKVWKSWKLTNFVDEYFSTTVFPFQLHLSFLIQFSRMSSSLYLYFHTTSLNQSCELS